ncbi:MAG: phosphoenolpyruvate carboxykinase (ATP) [SAR324 cluster bacterium]|nr:phosphoenolpyruvate carboxykinase (ATP) [SAR324 cluster bacterium]
MIDKSKLIEGVTCRGEVFHNLSIPQIVEHELKNKDGVLGQKGEMICDSGVHTGRSPKDKFVVVEDSTKDKIWWGSVNKELSEKSFSVLQNNVRNFLSDKNLYVFDGYAGTDVNHRLKIRIINTQAWHYHFVHNMFIVPAPEELVDFVPDFTILGACGYSEEERWKELGLRTKTFVTLNLGKKLGLIAGTEYPGEIKKGIFSIMNYLLPLKNVLPMHCSATVGAKKDVAIYFGLSGTGKTTLSADPNRLLIGDDEHGWTDKGIFNFEGGCYAKAIRLSPEVEPDIWNAIKFGAIVENVTYNKDTRLVDFDDSTVTENSRISYPVDHIRNIEISGQAGHPSYIFMLTCDAFGVLPPISKLTPDQASYHFLTGYTAKVAGTEMGVTDPKAAFSTCFGKPFMMQTPNVYGDLLAKKMVTHKTNAYLINTGWMGGKSGNRISLPDTRSIITAVLSGAIDKAKFVKDPVFGFLIPESLPNIESDILDPKKAWKNVDEYWNSYKELAKMFIENFEKEHSSYASHLIPFGPKL